MIDDTTTAAPDTAEAEVEKLPALNERVANFVDAMFEELKATPAESQLLVLLHILSALDKASHALASMADLPRFGVTILPRRVLESVGAILIEGLPAQKDPGECLMQITDSIAAAAAPFIEAKISQGTEADVQNMLYDKIIEVLSERKQKEPQGTIAEA